MRNEEKNEIPREKRGKFEESPNINFSPISINIGVLVHFYVTLFGHLLEIQEIFLLNEGNFASTKATLAFLAKFLNLLHFYVTIFGHFLEIQVMFLLNKPTFASIMSKSRLPWWLPGLGVVF